MLVKTPVGDKELSKEDRRRYLLTTISIYVGNIALGSSISAFAPTLGYFEEKFETDLPGISAAVTISTLCFIVGTLLVGFIYRFIRRQLGVIIFLYIMAGSVLLAVHIPTLELFYVLASVIGICIGAYDTSQIVWVMEMWQGRSGPYIQAQHFFTSIGYLIPGFLMAPFLKQLELDHTDSMWIPFTLLGSFGIFAATAQLFLFIWKPYSPPSIAEVKGDPENSAETEGGNAGTESSTKRIRIFLIVLCAIFLAFQIAMEQNSTLYISAFGQIGDHHLSESQGALLFTATMASFSLGRFTGIFAIFKISPFWILSFNFTALILANNFLLFSTNLGIWALWLGACLLGLGLSTVLASFYVIIRRHLVFTNLIGSIVLFSGPGLTALSRTIIASQLESNPMFYTYANFFSVVVIATALVIIKFVTRK